MKRHLRTVVVLAVAASLAGCASIGEINGVNIRPAAADSSSDFCATNPAVCILGGAAAAGGIGLGAWELLKTRHHGGGGSLPVS